MSNIFTRIPDERRQNNANVFDWSHTNNLSTKLGMITPIFTEKVPPKTSLKIDAKMAFQFMPMVFPVQTPIKARVSFYKMPLRALWKDYQNWVSSVNTPQHANYEQPYVGFFSDDTLSPEEFRSWFGNGSLADYFGIPSTYDGVLAQTFASLDPAVAGGSDLLFDTTTSDGVSVLGQVFNLRDQKYIPNEDTIKRAFVFYLPELNNLPSDLYNRKIGVNLANIEFALADGLADTSKVIVNGTTGWSKLLICEDTSEGLLCTEEFNFTTTVVSVGNGNPVEVACQTASDDTYFEFNYGSSTKLVLLIGGLTITTDDDFGAGSQTGGIYAINANFSLYGQTYGGSISQSTCPWFDRVHSRGIKIPSYPWRMYDAIYNTFIRYIRNNPLVDRFGVPQYNISTLSLNTPNGAMDNYYDTNYGSYPFVRQTAFEFMLPKYANWEFDQFTTAVPSPQQGRAPLVGITNYAQTTTLSDGSTQTALNTYVTDEDGQSYKVDLTANDEGLTGVEYTAVTMAEGVPVTTTYSAITEGISVLDIRNVNAYTKYLELDMRKGFRYKDIVEGRFDVNVRFDELLLPEFIGGFTRDVHMRSIEQTVQTAQSGTTYDGALGSKAGDAFISEYDAPTIKCYCDEASFVMGILSFTPSPVYTQTMPKWALDRDILDEWSPEFNNLGFQPIENAEVAPIQWYVNDPNNLHSTFGYQRPWYQYVAKYDTAHGDFRGPLRNFLMHRRFEGSPVLTKDFTVVDPDQVNDVFNVNEDTDKIFGQIYFDCTAKLGVAKDAIPSLEG